MSHNGRTRALAARLGGPDHAADTDSSARDGTRRRLCEVLDLESLCVLDHGGDDPVFTCLVNGVRLPPVPVEVLLSRSALLGVMVGPTRHVIPYFSPSEWAMVARALLRVAEPVDTESADEAELRIMLQGFLVKHGQVVLDADHVEDRRRAVVERVAGFVASRDGSVYVRLKEFHSHCRDEHDYEGSNIELRRQLDRLGFNKRNGHGKMCLTVDGIEFQGRYFSSPPGFFPTTEKG